MDNLEKVLINLEKKFSNLIFKISERDDSKKTYILYKEKVNEKSVSFETMIKESFKILKDSLDDKRIKDILVIYDYLDEINENDVLLHSVFNLDKEIEKNDLIEIFKPQHKDKKEIKIGLNEINLIDKHEYRKSKNIKIIDEYIGNLNNDYEEMENELWVA